MTGRRGAGIGPHIVEVLGRAVDAIPAGQGSVRLDEIRATAAGTAAGTAVDLAKLGATVTSFGAIGADLLADILLAALAGYQIDPGGLVMELTDLALTRFGGCDAVMLGGPDALAGLTDADLVAVVTAAKAAGALVAVD